MKTVSDIEYIKEKLKDVFPDAIRGSAAKSRWGCGRKELHLSYYILSDTVGGCKILAKGNLLYFIEWDTNGGDDILFAEQNNDDMIKRVSEKFSGKKTYIEKTGWVL